MGKCVSNKFLLFLALCFFAAFLCAPAKTQQLLILSGQVFGLSEGRPLPSGVGGVSSKAAASIFVPQHCGPFTAVMVALAPYLSGARWC